MDSNSLSITFTFKPIPAITTIKAYENKAMMFPHYENTYSLNLLNDGNETEQIVKSEAYTAPAQIHYQRSFHKLKKSQFFSTATTSHSITVIRSNFACTLFLQ